MANDGKFARWQAIAIEQLGYVIGLVLTFATASLGFALTLVKDQTYGSSTCGKMSMDGTILCFILSVSLGIWCVINRLNDFRETKDIARKREQIAGLWEPERSRDLNARSDANDVRGERTWCLFYWQIALFAFGVALTVLAFVLTYEARLRFW